MNLFTRRPIGNGMVGKGILLATLALSGCSASSLRCSTDSDSSFVELINIPQDIGGQSRHFKELCAFAYEGEDTQ